jgi:hypothetical protein
MTRLRLPKIKVVIFVSRDTPSAFDAGRALFEAVARFPAPSAVTAQLIDRLSANIDDLRMLAAHRIVSTPTTLIVRGEIEAVRALRVLEPDEALTLIHSLV